MERLVWITEKRKVKDLLAWDGNPRKLSNEEHMKLKSSLEKFNLVEIPAIDIDNRLIAGHQRVRIMLELGRGEEEIDVRVPNRKLTDQEFKQYNIASNRISGEWDFEKLSGFDETDLLAGGFDQSEINVFMKIEPDENEDVIPITPDVPTTRPGDVYLLGKHKLVCGDSTTHKTYEILVGGGYC